MRVARDTCEPRAAACTLVQTWMHAVIAEALPAVPAVDITYFTDPLCSWSWAFEPEWRRLRFELGDQLEWRYRMAGMIPDWKRYADPLSDVSAPAHMGPQWLGVSQISGMPIEPRIWHDDPPASSYPACLAVKAAELQGCTVGDRYLRRVREAVMLERRNVGRREVLLGLADEVADHRSVGVALDAAEFRRALDDGEALAAFRSDLGDTRYREIGRFPTLIVRGHSERAVILVGHRPYTALLEAVRLVAPGIALRLLPSSAEEYVNFWQDATRCLTRREVEEGLGIARGSAATGWEPAEGSSS